MAPSKKKPFFIINIIRKIRVGCGLHTAPFPSSTPRDGSPVVHCCWGQINGNQGGVWVAHRPGNSPPLRGPFAVVLTAFLILTLNPRLPNRYRILLPIVDVIFAQPDQARIVVHNAESFLKDGGHVIISIKASCIDSTMPPETIFASQVQFLQVQASGTSDAGAL